jgi:cullin 3
VAVDDIWSKLTNNIREIQHHRAHTLSFEENYRFSYQMVLTKNGPMLYNGVVDLVVQNLDRLSAEFIIPVFPSSLDKEPAERAHDNARLLKALTHVWEDHADSMEKIGSILKYMVRYIHAF